MEYDSLTPFMVAFDILKIIVITVLSISFIVFVALFGRLPVFRKTPIGWIHRLLLIHLPNALLSIDGFITGGRFSSQIIRFYKYVASGRHPIVLIIFVLLQVISELFWISPALPHLTPIHTYLLIPVLITLPYLSLYLSTTTTSHYITPANYEHYLRSYPYDYTLYHPHQPCRTCSSPESPYNLPLPPSKPARSKHCSICRACIARMDHHCIWINNCVGQSNYHYFLALLASISLLLAYGSLKGLSILNALAQKRFVPASLTLGSVTSKKWATGLTWSDYLEKCSLLIAFNARLGATTLLATMSLPLALGFLGYHAYLIWAGMTTNETQKWSDLREDIWDGLVWKARIDEMKDEYPGPLDESIVYDAGHHGSGGRSRNGRGPSWAGGRRGAWWVITVGENVMPLRRAFVEGKEVDVPDERFRRVRELGEVVNLYDLGWWRNLQDALFKH